jgi:Protein of unknown function (DUF3810)
MKQMQKGTKKHLSIKVRRLILWGWPFILALMVFISTRFFIHAPEFIERYYSEGLYPVIAKCLSFFSRLVPFSLWDVFWVIIIILLIGGFLSALLKKIKFGWYILRTLQVLAILYSSFYVLWGYNYFRPNIQTRIGWPVTKPDTAVFKTVLDSLIMETNRSYLPSVTSDRSKINTLVEDSYLANSRELKINYPNGYRRPKTMIFSSLYSKLGLSGYFGPFFNEIHVNSNLLPVDYPFVLAHEKAHQFGFTSEAEANFVAFVICTQSPDSTLRYSGYQSVLSYFLRDASRLRGYKSYFSKVDKRVIADYRSRQKYYAGLENRRLSNMQTAVNNSYLKINNIESGVRNYNQVVSLVTGWYYNSILRK